MAFPLLDNFTGTERANLEQRIWIIKAEPIYIRPWISGGESNVDSFPKAENFSIAKDGYTIFMVDQRVLNTDGLPVSLFSQFSTVRAYALHASVIHAQQQGHNLQQFDSFDFPQEDDEFDNLF